MAPNSHSAETDSVWSQQAVRMLKIVLSGVLIMWAVRRVLNPGALANFDVLFPFVEDHARLLEIGTSTLEIAIAAGLWKSRTIKAALLGAGVLVTFRLGIAGVHARLESLSGCDVTLLGGDPVLILVQHAVLYGVVVSTWWFHGS